MNFQNWLDKWDAMDPDTQRKWKIAGALAALLVLAIAVQKLSHKDRPKFERTKVETTMMLPESQKMDMENLHAEVYRLGRENAQLKQQIDTSNENLGKRLQQELETAKEQGRLGDPTQDEELNRLRAELEDLRADRALSPGAGANAPGRAGRSGGPNMAGNLPSPNMNVGPGAQTLAPIPSYDPTLAPPAAGALPGTAGTDGGLGGTTLKSEPAVGLRITSGDNQQGEASGGTVGTADAGKAAGATPAAPAGKTASAPASQNQKKEPEVFLPAGSIIQGVLLSGLDAPTSSHGQKNPTPVLVRIKHEAILPNYFKADIRECFVILSGFGSMSTERAMLRSETISCLRKDGGVIETSLQGTAIGEDGKVGLRGRLVTKQGALLAKSMTAGFFSGLANAAKPSAIAAVNTSPGSTTDYQTPDFDKLLASGVGEGAANALNQVSKFYLDMAKEMFPVIEVDAGRNIEIVMVKGTSLKLRGRGDSRTRNARR